MPYPRLGAITRALPFLLAVPGLAYGQAAQPPAPAEAQAALSPAPAAFTPAQLDQMLAPIALYPDQLLLELLMAATFPQQVVDAGKWLHDGNNAGLSGDQLVAAVQPLPWDPSVKSLVAFPQIVTMLNDHLDWTEALGTAFANQQIALMARIQFLRQRAVTAGRLASTPHLVVHHQEREIVIEPADPAMIYVPVYNPAEAYGDWPDRDAPPIYIPPPPGFFAGAVGAGIGFSVGFGVAAPLWGWGHPDWRRHEVVVDPDRYGRITDPRDAERNQIRVDHEVWHRTAPLVRVPEAQRPHPAAANAPHPAGTVGAAAVVLPKPAPAAPPQATGAVHPPAVPPHPVEAVHPPAVLPHPVEAAHPPAVLPHPVEAAHPPAVLPHPVEAAHPLAAPPHPAPAPHPLAAPPHPAPAPHPLAAPPHPAPAPHPPAAPPHPAPAPHPLAAPPHPAPAPHPLAAPPHPPAGAHPAAPPPAKKPPPKPGEEEKGQH
jgi:hypothetical protein